MPPRHLEIVHVVGRRDLHRAGPELAVHHLVGHHGNRPVHQRQPQGRPDPPGVPVVLRVDRDGGVAQHRLGTRGRDDDALLPGHPRVADVPERPLLLHVGDLEVGERRAAAGTPVDDVSPAVDEPLPVEPDERFADRAGEPLVHREPLALPVARGAQALQLVQDRAAALLLPLPDPLDEGLPPQFLPGDPLLRELPLHHVLGGDPGVVGARKPEGVAPVHPGVSQKDVLQRDVQRVPHVKGAGDVRRRDDDRERIARPGRVGVKGARRDPGGVPALLHGLRVVRFLFLRFLLAHPCGRGGRLPGLGRGSGRSLRG